jgi:2,3-bisphosphoglycerate-independent phosphoglycerate mutase
MKSVQAITDKVLLIILDGFGINANEQKNAIKSANTPHLDQLFQHYPFTTIEAGGESVGLPAGVVGNSEVGHMNLGAGRPVRQDLVRINEAIDNDDLKKMPHLIKLIETAKTNTKRIHFIGLISDGGVHSHIEHLKALLKITSKEPELSIFLHGLTDGRDTPPISAEKYIQEISTFKGFTWGSLQGRSVGMDRDRRWDKIKLAYDTFLGAGKKTALSPIDYLNEEYAQGRTDEFLEPALFSEDAAIKEGDCIFFLNFRPDRAIQLTLAFNDPAFKEFEQKFIPPYFLCMTPYVPDEVKLPILFDKENVPGGLSEYLSGLGKKQFKIAETEKYAHVTYFFNGGEKKPFQGEEHKLIPSPREVKTYNLKPEMSAPEVTKQLMLAMEKDFDFFIVNYANCDMVGHTGDFKAAVKAVEFVDKCIGELVNHAQKYGITVLVTADHGNSDQMVYPDGSPHTAHTGAPVPFSLVDSKLKDSGLIAREGQKSLQDVAPTILYLLGIEQPKLFTGQPIFL